jgi:Zn-dependent M28 family amino/carboxypeptidase
MGVINMDMIAYADRLPEDLDLVVNLRSEWLANRFSICASIYTPLDLLKVVNANFRYSDHSSFWDQGYSAVCGIEDSIVTNPYYHKTTDTYSTLNMDFAASVTKIALAVAAGLAQPAIQ